MEAKEFHVLIDGVSNTICTFEESRFILPGNVWMYGNEHLATSVESGFFWKEKLSLWKYLYTGVQPISSRRWGVSGQGSPLGLKLDVRHWKLISWRYLNLPCLWMILSNPLLVELVYFFKCWTVPMFGRKWRNSYYTYLMLQVLSVLELNVTKCQIYPLWASREVAFMPLLLFNALVSAAKRNAITFLIKQL